MCHNHAQVQRVSRTMLRFLQSIWRGYGLALQEMCQPCQKVNMLNVYDLDNVHDELYDLDNVRDELYDLNNVPV